MQTGINNDLFYVRVIQLINHLPMCKNIESLFRIINGEAKVLFLFI